MKLLKLYNQQTQLKEFEKILHQFCDFESSAKEIYRKEYYDYVSHPSPSEVQSTVQKICAEKYKMNYELCRSNLAQNIPIMQRMGADLGVNTKRIGQAPAIIGGTMFEIDVFSSLLEQPGYVELEPIIVFDTVNKMRGILRANIKKEWLNMANPLSWVSFILKIPFFLIKQTGFNIDKIENELWGKVIKTLCLFFLIWLLLRLGFTHEQLIGFFKFK